MIRARTARLVLVLFLGAALAPAVLPPLAAQEVAQGTARRSTGPAVK